MTAAMDLGLIERVAITLDIPNYRAAETLRTILDIIAEPTDAQWQAVHVAICFAHDNGADEAHAAWCAVVAVLMKGLAADRPHDGE